MKKSMTPPKAMHPESGSKVKRNVFNNTGSKLTESKVFFGQIILVELNVKNP